MALQGNIETFALPDVLQLLSSTKKTGRLRLEGDRGEGRIWVAEGALVAGQDGETTTGAVEALVALLRFDSGDFEFDQDETHDAPGDPVPVDEALEAAAGMVAELQALEERIPSGDAWVTLADELPGDEVTLDAGRWRTIVAVGGGRRVRDLGADQELSDLDNMRSLSGLLDLGVIAIAQEAPAGAPAAAPAEPAGGEPLGTAGPGPDLGEVDEEPPTGMPVFEYPTAGTDSVLPGSLPDGESGPLVSFDPVEADEPGLTLVGDDAFEPFDASALVIEDEPLGDPGADEVPAAGDVDEDPPDAAEIARQLASLSPKAAKAVAAAAKASSEEEREEALRSLDDEETSLNRELLLKFLGSVNN